MARVVHFEIHVDDPARASEFYSQAFGWDIQKWEGPEGSPEYWMVMTGDKDQPGINGGMTKRQDPAPDGSNTPMNAYVCIVDVADINQALSKIKEHNGQVIQDKQSVPKIGQLAYCKDTEGNVFGVMQAEAPMN